MFANSQLQRVLSGCVRESRDVLRGRWLCSAAEEVRRPKVRGNSEFVKRREKYRHKVHDIRVAFQEEVMKDEEKKDDGEVMDLEAIRSAREKRKRERSIARQVGHKEHMARIQEVKQERKAYRRQTWLENKKSNEQAKLKVIERLNEEADKWMTEESMEREVEKAVDDFFIVGASAQREIKKMVE